MHVEVFTDQYELAAPLYDTSPSELQARNHGERWLAIRGNRAVGAATALLRPDRRMFIDFACSEISAYGVLTEAVADALARPLYTTVDQDDRSALIALRAAGFAADLEAERFSIRFDTALSALRRARIPSGLAVVSANEVEEGRLFTLDNSIRHDVPGTDGWRGNRDWFHAELVDSPPFDPAAYLVAVDTTNDEYVALVRIWRNPEGPRLGLVGVLPQYRRTLIAAALLSEALAAAATWGHGAFATETATGTAMHRHIRRLNAASLGRFQRMIRL